MLVLSRDMDERIKIQTPDGTVIDILVVEVRSGRRVRIGIDAPEDYAVHREEVFDAIQREKEADSC